MQAKNLVKFYLIYCKSLTSKQAQQAADSKKYFQRNFINKMFRQKKLAQKKCQCVNKYLSPLILLG